MTVRDALLLRAEDAGRDVWLVWPPDRHHQPKMRAFVDHVASLFA